MEQGYIEIKSTIGSTIESAVDQLIKKKEEGVLAMLNFNGIVLYSDTVTLESAYKQIVGMTKEQFDSRAEKRAMKAEQQKIYHLSRIPEMAKKWMDEGRNILNREKIPEWDSIVAPRLHDMYAGMELGNCLDIVKVLNEGGTLEQAREVLDNQSHSGMSVRLVARMVQAFATGERGKEFAESLNLDL